MKIFPVIVSLVLASGMLGYGIAFGQSSSFGTPTTASHPYAQICGDHPCKPGEVYNPGGSANATVTAKANATANVGGPPTLASQTTVSANVTATKITNGTTLSSQTSVSANATATKTTNGTVITPPMTNQTATTTTNATATAKALPTPAQQVRSGTAPASVQCPSGYQLALNKFDSRPACVTPDVYAKLVARGWAS